MATELKDTPASRINNVLTVFAMKPSERDGGIALTATETDGVVQLLKDAVAELRARRIVQIAACANSGTDGTHGFETERLYALDDCGRAWWLDYPPNAMAPLPAVTPWKALPPLPQELNHG